MALVLEDDWELSQTTQTEGFKTQEAAQAASFIYYSFLSRACTGVDSGPGGVVKTYIDFLQVAIINNIAPSDNSSSWFSSKHKL